MDRLYSVATGLIGKGQSHIYRQPRFVNKLFQAPEGCNTMAALWRRTVEKFASNRCLEDYTYRQVDEMTNYIGSWLRQNKYDIVYIHSINRVEWMLMDIACMKYGIISVALYDSLGRQALEHTMGLTEGRIVAESKTSAVSLLKASPKNLKDIKHIILFDEVDKETEEQIRRLGINIVMLKQIIDLKMLVSPPLVRPEDPFSYCFTSGTTGLPKGVIITHKNFSTEMQVLLGEFPIDDKDIHLSYLPLQHIFQRCFIHFSMINGAQVRFYSGNIMELAKDLARVRPTIMPIVPRLLNRFYTMLRPFSHVDKKLAEEAWKVKLENWRKGIKTSPYDQSVFQKAKDVFGGRLKFMITGSAPIAADVLEFFMVVLGCQIREVYGQTESTGGSFCTKPGDRTAGHVGSICGALEYKLIDVPQMNYRSDGPQPRGQILVRGATIFKGYHKDPKKTQEAIDQLGWLHTGDVGEICSDGSLKVIDRRKNIYKLSQGQYIAPQKIQNVYLRCPLVAQAFVYGDSLQHFNVAIIVPNKDVLLKIAKDKGITKSFEEMCEDSNINHMILNQMTQQGQYDGLLGFEQVKKIKLHPTSFGAYGIFTNTLKLQRPKAKQTFKEAIDRLYKES